MKHRYATAILLLCIACSLLQGSEVSIGTTYIATALSKADIALAKSLVNPTAFKGSLGEALAGQQFLKNTLSQNGDWRSITPRSGPQGLDHLFIKTNSRGTPTSLLVGESKYNTSRLGDTKDGIQVGPKWTNSRIAALGSRYADAANSSNISLKPIPLNPNRQISVVLRNGKERFFWKNSSKDTWKFSGSQAELKEAKQLAKSYGHFFQKAGSGAVSYRSRIFNIVPEGNNLRIDTYDTKNLAMGAKSLKQLNKISSFSIKNALADKKIPGSVQKEIAANLKSKLNLSEKDARILTKKLSRRYSPGEFMQKSSFVKDAALHSLKAAFFSAAIDGAIQFASNQTIDYRKTALTAASTLAGVSVGQAIQYGLMTSPGAATIVQNISGPLKCSASVINNSFSAFGGSIVASAIMSYGMYFLGYQDLQSANRQMVIGTAAAGAATAFSIGTMSAIAMWGTASTGTAIASLSGAAATSASLAFLGGSVFMGTAILSGGTIIVAAAVTYLGHQVFKWIDENNDNKKISKIIEQLKQDHIIEKVVENSTYYKQLCI